MALVGNGSVLHKSPGRFLNGYGTAGGHIASIRSAFSKHGMMRGAAFEALSSRPYGYYDGAWMMAETAGGLSSNDSVMAVSPNATAVGGIASPGTAGITFTVADAEGQLISSGSGSASMAFTVANLLLTASLGGEGAASMQISTNTPLLGALAGGSGASSMAFSGSLVPYAVGNMSGSTVDSGVLTVDAIAAGVLAAALAAPIRADIAKVNNYSVQGSGQPGNEWRP